MEKSESKALDPLEVLMLAKRKGKNNKYFARVHRRSQQRVSQAFKGEAPELLQKIYKHLLTIE